MILVDTSVWVDHLRRFDSDVAGLLESGHVLAHPFVTGELACGYLKNRAAILSLLRDLPAAPVATDEEVLAFIDRRKLAGRGLGYVDAHLLCSVALEGTAQLWSRDKRLDAIAEEMGVDWTLSRGR